MGSKHDVNASLVIGLVAIAAGVILLLDHFNVIHAFNFFRLWPLIMVVAGVGGLFGEHARRKLVGNAMMILVGILFLLEEFHYLTWGQLWPVLLIGVGLILVFRAFQRDKQLPESSSGGALNATAIFSGFEKRVTARDFEKASATAIFGGVELDFTQADIAGDTATMDVNVAFGGIEMRIPDNWHVVIETSIVFAGVENNSRSPLPTSNAKKLVVRGDVVFGGLEIKN